jgi:cell division septal protein FtsQ
MVKIYKERTIKIFKYLTYLFKAHLPEIVFLVIVIQILFSLNALPYFNIM